MTVISLKTTSAPEKPSNEAMYCIPQAQQQTSFAALQRSVKICKKWFTTCIVYVCTFILVASILLIALKPSSEVVNVVIIDVKNSPVFVTNKNFLSVALDSSVIAEGFRNFNMTDPKLEKVLSALAPGYFRVGGTMADRLHFNPKNEQIYKIKQVSSIDGDACAFENEKCDIYLRPNYTMSGDEWLQLNHFISKSGFTLLFDLNCLTRFANGSWDYANAEELIAFSARHNLSVIWELGNEPDAFRHVFNYEVNATQLGKDFIILKGILEKFSIYKDAFLVGPDTTRPRASHQESVKYLNEFLEIAGDTVNAITWHQYYLNGRTATGYDFIDPAVLDLLQYQIDVIVESVDKYGLNKPIWLGETSSAYGGGAQDLSNRFVSTFMWLDKLGLAAKNGLDLVIRQSFFKGYYALIYNNYSPAPDFWISVLYKQLVGNQVVNCHTISSNRVRMYCHCANSDIPSIVVFAINLRAEESKVRLAFSNDEQIDLHNILAYVIRTEYSLLSRITVLNSDYLFLETNGDLPQFNPKIISAEPFLTLPAYSLAFWVVPVPTATYCAK